MYYRLHVNNISFNQTFKQKKTKQKTLHSSSSLIEGSEINEANPAQFELDLAILDESSLYQQKPIQLLLKNTGDTLETFNLFIDVSKSTDSSRTMYKLDTCVLESGSFSFDRQSTMAVNLQGSASKLSTISWINISVGQFDTTPTYSIPKITTVTVDGTVLDQVTGLNLEIQNNIDWTKNTTLQDSYFITASSGTIYPASFTLGGRAVAGNVTTYVGSSHPNLQTWKENIAISIKTGLAANNYQLQAALTPCSFTNRVNPTEVFTQGYDFRMMGSPENLDDLFTY